MKKKVLSIMLSIIILFGSSYCWLYSYAKNSLMNYNKNLLESILSDRYWLIETLVDGNLNNNIYAATNGQTGFMLNEVLENYQKDEAFKFLVDAMERYSNGDEYASGLTDSILSTLMELFGLSEIDEVGSNVDSLVKSVDELKYESIIKDVLVNDYTSSWGETYNEQNMQYEIMKQSAEICNNISNFSSSAADIIGLSSSGLQGSVITYDPFNENEADYKVTTENYVNHILKSYEGVVSNLVNDDKFEMLDSNKALKKKVLEASSVALASAYQKVVFDTSETSPMLAQIFCEDFSEEYASLAKKSGKAFKLADNVLEQCILADSIVAQKEGMTATLNRVAINTPDKNIKKTMNGFNKIVDDSSDEYILNQIAEYCGSEKVISNFVKSKIEKSLSKYAIDAATFPVKSAKQMSCSAVMKALSIIELSTWVADTATGIKDTSKKTYICKYINKLINEVVKTYKIDLKNYQNNKTDENAALVLKDLELLKALRLYGEKTAYDTIRNQTDSWIGILLGGNDVAEYLDTKNQNSIDNLLGCSFERKSASEITLSEGDIFTIADDTTQGGKKFTRAVWKKASGGTITFAEPDYKLANGIYLNGGELRIISACEGCYIPFVKSSVAGGKISIYCSDVGFGELECNTNTEIALENDTAELTIFDKLTNNSTLTISNANAEKSILINDITNQGTINASNILLNINGHLINDGDINCKVNIYGCGDPLFDVYFSKPLYQAISGNGTITELYFNNNTTRGVGIYGIQKVTKFLSTGKTRIRSGKNIHLSGNCAIENNYYKGDVTFEDYNSNSNLTIEGDATVINSASFNGNIVVKGILNVTNSCQNFIVNGNVSVMGDTLFYAKNSTIAGDLKLYGNLKTDNNTGVIDKIEFAGNTPQTIQSSITVNKLINSNKSKSGITVEGTVTLLKYLRNVNGAKFANGTNIFLTNSAEIIGELKGGISAKNWTCNNDAVIKGSLRLYEKCDINGNLTVKGITTSKGELTLAKDKTLSTTEMKISSGSFNNNGKVIVKEDSVFLAPISNGYWEFHGSVDASAPINIDTLEMTSNTTQVFNNSSTTNVKALLLNNKSLSGITIGSKITVSEDYKTTSVKVINQDNIIILSNTVTDNTFEGNYNVNSELTVSEDINVKGSLNVSDGSKFSIDNGATVFVNKKADLGNATIIVKNGATLEIKNGVKANSTTIIIENGGRLVIGDYIYTSNCSITADGDIVVKGDSRLNSSTVSGAGLITLYGDLDTSSCTWNKPNLNLKSKVPQIISGSAITVNNLTVDNTSKSGVSLDTSIKYYGVYEKNTSVIKAEDKIISNS